MRDASGERFQAQYQSVPIRATSSPLPPVGPTRETTSVLPAISPTTQVPFREGPRPVLAAVGRLVEAKGFDVLLDALREVDASLWIIGEGPLRADLEADRKSTRLNSSH